MLKDTNPNFKPRKFVQERTMGIGSQNLRLGEDMKPLTVRKTSMVKKQHTVPQILWLLGQGNEL